MYEATAPSVTSTPPMQGALPPPPPMHEEPPPSPPVYGAPVPPPPPPPPPRALGPPRSPPPPPPHGQLGGECGGPVVKKSNLKPLQWNKVTRPLQGSMWEELQSQSPPDIDISELEALFSDVAPKKAAPNEAEKKKDASSNPEKIDLKWVNNKEIMPLPDMVDAVLAMKDTLLDVDQVEYILKTCPTKEEMEQLKLIAAKAPALLDFPEDLVSLEAATGIQSESIAEEMQALILGLKKVKQELDACAKDGPVSQGFRMKLKEIIGHAELEVASVNSFYSIVGKKADGLARDILVRILRVSLSNKLLKPFSTLLDYS